MGRHGKVKYRDVVGGGKQKKKQNKKNPVKKPRKTYSLYQRDNHKRRNEQGDAQKSAKRPRIEELPKQEPQVQRNDVESSSSEEEEEVDHLKQLRATFSNHSNKESLAIDSSEDSLEEEEEHEEEASEKSEPEDLENAEKPESEVENEENETPIDTVEDADESEDIEDSNDPFIKHVSYDLHENSLKILQDPNPSESTIITWPVLKKLIVQIPQYESVQEQKSQLAEVKTFAPKGEIPTILSDRFQNSLFIKPQIVNHLKQANVALEDQTKLFTPLQSELFSIINNYQDLYYPERTSKNSEEIRFVYCLHVVNHILKTRMKIIHHNARLAKKEDVPEEFRDQGLVRPKILIIVPFKDAAYKIIQTIITILLTDDNKGSVMNKKRFVDEFTGNELAMPKKNPKPEDYELTFTGNTSDDFKIGLSVTKKSLRLYSEFYSSDIIVASPLGLRTIIGAEGEPERNYDFLASMELLILDQTELFMMQNWDHLIHIFNHLHLQPKESHGTDFSRVRTWCLNGWAKYYRQTLIFSSLILPEINAIFNKKCNNFAGKVKVANTIETGAISQVFVQIPHVFHKFNTPNVQEASNSRFDFFVSKILPQQKDSLMKQTLIFVSNYFDYVRLRNYFKREDISFVQICEYSKDGKIARARDMFFHGDAHFLLYTERHHFFNRIRIKGIRHLVFYQPPNFPHFYYEMCNLMQQGNMNKKIGNVSNMSVNVLYSKYDVHQLAAIVGSERASKMLNSERNVHMMVTGSD